MIPANEDVLASFELHMMTAKLSPVTISDRLEVIRRLARYLPAGLLAATPAELELHQQRFANLRRATIDIYSRHIRAFYQWAVRAGLIDADPCVRMVTIRPRRGVPHPIRADDLRLLLACATGGLRTAYVLAAFAGLRCGEICRLRGDDLNLDAPQPTALIHGKGEHERIVPLLPPVVAELRVLGFPRSGVVALSARGRAYEPERLSSESTRFMHSLGLRSTLHGLRHYFASEVVRLTRDVLLVRDLLGHANVATTQIYMASSIDGAADRLAAFSAGARSLIDNSAANSTG